MRLWGWKMVLLLLVGGLVFVWLIKAPIMASYLSDKLKVPVSIGGISIWPSQTNMYNFRINNPRGFKTKTAFEAMVTHVDYDFHRLLNNPSEIENVLLSGVFLSIEFSNPLGTQNNWTAISAGIPEREEKQSGHEVIIRRLVLEDLTVQIRGLGLIGAPQTRRVDRIEFRNVSSEKGFPTRELIQALFQKAGMQQYIQDAFNPQKAIQRYLSPFGLLWDEKARVVTE